jgi:hypothetical protein
MTGTMFMKEVIAARKRDVQVLGVHVNSSWSEQPEGATLSEAEMKHIAERDLSELLRSELCLVDATEKSSSSGYHSEVGAALAAGITVWVVADRAKVSNVFFRLAYRWFDSWEQAKAALLAHKDSSVAAVAQARQPVTLPTGRRTSNPDCVDCRRERRKKYRHTKKSATA